MVAIRLPCAAPPPSLALTGEPDTFCHLFAEDGTRVMFLGRSGSPREGPLRASSRRRVSLNTCLVQPHSHCTSIGKGSQNTPPGVDCASPRKAEKRKKIRSQGKCVC